jgi:hypothetical protein
VAEWVRHEGKPIIFYGWLAKELRFGTGADVPMMHKGYSTTKSKVDYGFHVFADQADVVMVRVTTEESLFWRVTRAGEITRTLWTSPNDAKIVPNDRYMDWWRETRDFFFWRIKNDTAKTD